MSEPLSINIVAKKLHVSVHQLRRWELLFGLEIKRGKGQQRQYSPRDYRVMERIKELVDQGWPTSQVAQQLETEGFIAPKLIGLPSASRTSESLAESIIGVRNFCERRLSEIEQQLSEIQQILMSFSLKQQTPEAEYSPWQPVAEMVQETPPAEEEILHPAPLLNISAPVPELSLVKDTVHSEGNEPAVAPLNVAPEITDQNFLTVLGKTLDLVGWSDSQADEYSTKNYGVAVWIDLGRSDAEKFISYLRSLSADVTAGTQDIASPPAPLNISFYNNRLDVVAQI